MTELCVQKTVKTPHITNNNRLNFEGCNSSRDYFSNSQQLLPRTLLVPNFGDVSPQQFLSKERFLFDTRSLSLFNLRNLSLLYVAYNAPSSNSESFVSIKKQRI